MSKRGPESRIEVWDSGFQNVLTFIYFFGECSSDAGYALQSTRFFILGGHPCQFQNDGWRAAKISETGAGCAKACSRPTHTGEIASRM
jgi:hypothetical protein